MRPFAPLRVLVVSLLIGFVAQAGFAQSQTTPSLPPPVRDAQAVTIVQQSIAAMGGAAAGATQNVQVQGTLSPAPGSYVTSGNFIWLDDFSGSTFEFRHELDTASVARVEASGHGSPAVEQGSTVKALRAHVTYTALPYHLPVVLLSRELANSNYSIQMGAPTTVEGKPAVQVIIKTQTGVIENALSEQHWDFDATTGLPVRIEYRLASTINAIDSIPGAVELSDYREVTGIAVPYQITVFEDATATSTATISSVAFNVTAPASTFDLITGGAQ
jgi:hypothetical protein